LRRRSRIRWISPQSLTRPTRLRASQPTASRPYQHEQAGHQNGTRSDEGQDEGDGGDEGGDDLDGSGAHGAVNV
jgi:hypothetical protein